MSNASGCVSMICISDRQNDATETDAALEAAQRDRLVRLQALAMQLTVALELARRAARVDTNYALVLTIIQSACQTYHHIAAGQATEAIPIPTKRRWRDLIKAWLPRWLSEND